MAGYKKKVQDLESILLFSGELLLERNINRLLELIAERACQILGAERATIFLLDTESQELWSRVALKSEISEIRVPLGVGIVGKVAQTQELINIENAYEDSRFHPEIDKKTGYRTRTILCAPLANNQGITIGAIQVLNKKNGTFTSYHESIIRLFASFSAFVLDNAQLVNDQELMILSFFKSLAAAVDAKDPVTSGHSERVSKYAVNLAKALGYPESEVKVVQYAALLHDVGKIGIKDHILLKPGLLTPQEYSVMKEHVVKTREILEKIYLPKILKPIVHIAASHHERLDGSGYPDGVKEDQLSQAARILCISDVYDALTSYDRPYKRAMSHEEARTILESGKGNLFDIQLIDLFFEKKLYLIDIREFQRIDAELIVEYTFLQEGMARPLATPTLEQEGTKTINISPGGLLFQSKLDIPVGTYLDMTLHFPDKRFRVLCRGVRTERNPDNTFHIGVRFLNINPSLLERLTKYMKDLETREDGKNPYLSQEVIV